MKPAFSFEQIRDIEKKIIDTDSVPSLILMENAGKNSFELIKNHFPDISEHEIYIFTGKGNNAGDGFVIARQMLINGISFTIVNVTTGAGLKGDALTNFEILQKEQSSLFEIIPFSDFTGRYNKKSQNIFIDSVLGSGISGKLSPEFENYIGTVNELKKKSKKLHIVSIDVPSGLMSGEQLNPVIKADMTITMGAVKTELLFGAGKENSGVINVAPIGISESYLNSFNKFNKKIPGIDDVRELYPKRKKTSYKYSNGKALIVGGSAGLSGAVIMSSASALKSGAGAVISAIPNSISAHFSRKQVDVIKTMLNETPEGTISADSFNKLTGRINAADAVLIGPGISLNSDTKKFVLEFIKKCSKNLVIDADALTILAGDVNVLINREYGNEIILTPHLGEFSRLSGLSAKDITLNRFDTVCRFAKKFGVNVVMKSETTFTCLKNGEIFINPTGNESLGTVGSGDVLSGIIVSLLAQTMDVKSSLICGNYLHGLCADLYYKKYGNKQSASQTDFIKIIPKAVTYILEQTD
jgi:ADP-dependent NAD(P)H-hydrate dehydratase / NAD(P)H-hydrate epimerase